MSKPPLRPHSAVTHTHASPDLPQQLQNPHQRPHKPSLSPVDSHTHAKSPKTLQTVTLSAIATLPAPTLPFAPMSDARPSTSPPAKSKTVAGRRQESAEASQTATPDASGFLYQSSSPLVSNHVLQSDEASVSELEDLVIPSGSKSSVESKPMGKESTLPVVPSQPLPKVTHSSSQSSASKGSPGHHFVQRPSRPSPVQSSRVSSSSGLSVASESAHTSPQSRHSKEKLAKRVNGSATSGIGPSSINPQRQTRLPHANEASASPQAAALHQVREPIRVPGSEAREPVNAKGIEKQTSRGNGTSSSDTVQRDPPLAVSGSEQLGLETASAASSDNSVDPETLLGIRGSYLSSYDPVDYESLVNSNGNLKRISAVSCLEVSEKDLEEIIIELVENQGEPLVISDLHKTQAWSSDLFSLQGYESLRPSVTADGETVFVRNLTDWTDRALPLPEFLAHCDSQRIYSPEQRDKLYGKDLPCPVPWREALDKLVHPRLAYHGKQDMSASLQLKARAETLMCHFGPGRTCTPLHRDLCSSLGQNLMVWSDPDASALWMITHPDDAEAVDKYIASKGGDPHSEGYAPHPNELANAPFSVFCWKQRVGDLVLIPSRASHMVVNDGGRTMKTAWSRLTVDTLTSALFSDLPLYQRICRLESFHIRPVIEQTLTSFTVQVEMNLALKRDVTSTLVRDLRNLLQLYDAILSDEYVSEWRDIAVEGDHDSYVECDFCGAGVLHGYFECPAGETLCALCYCQGRLCSCADAIEALQPRQHWRQFGERLEFRNQAAQALLSADPTLALTIEERDAADEEDADEEAPLLQVEMLKEEDVEKQNWPLSFMAAMNLYKCRRSPGWQTSMAQCKICKASLDLSQRIFCKPCGHSYCHGCLLHKMYIHPAHALAQKDAKPFHKYHKRDSTLDYKEWKQDPVGWRDEARAHFFLIEAARTNMKCVPVHKDCRIGFLDVSDRHPRGLSGTLGVKRPAKTQVDEAKTVTAASSPSTTPVSRKRPKGLDKTTPVGSPRSPAKKAKLQASTSFQPMEVDEIVAQVPRTQVPAGVPVTPPVPPQSIHSVPSSPIGSIASWQRAPKPPNASSITVMDGIRRFKLRLKEQERPAPPSGASSAATPPPSLLARSSVPSASPDVAASKPVATEKSASETVDATVVDAVRGTAPMASSSTRIAAVPSPTVIADVVESSKASVSPATMSANGTSSVEITSVSITPTAPASGVAAKQTNLAPAPRITSPSRVATIETGDPGTLSLATSVIAAGISSSPQAPAATSTGASPTGLGSLDSMNLRVVTEILRIFSHSNQRLIEGQVADLKKAQVEQMGELKRMQAKQAEEHRKATAKVEATLLHRIDQLEQEMKRQAHQHTAEMRRLANKREASMERVQRQLDEVVRQQAGTVDRVNRFDEKFSGLMDDIDRQAQAHLQAELSSQTSQSFGSGQLAPTSHTR
ncbi:predicted hydroxylase [Pseudozyma hubeiensis SY62]|uniref:Predicted hydroxylase n=1 Tax=Pseudozyma hubeiensis (strain SY62) TaxID=1305764 RepID=R9NZC1_PSEHS|nr:predicted hydroxylase [Pseudozyma hubeiensis SY62]GAC94106.1 predicted hydroxylase [Pseudozyma hubeiensis SY62]